MLKYLSQNTKVLWLKKKNTLIPTHINNSSIVHHNKRMSFLKYVNCPSFKNICEGYSKKYKYIPKVFSSILILNKSGAILKVNIKRYAILLTTEYYKVLSPFKQRSHNS